MGNSAESTVARRTLARFEVLLAFLSGKRADVDFVRCFPVVTSSCDPLSLMMVGLEPALLRDSSDGRLSTDELALLEFWKLWRLASALVVAETGHMADLGRTRGRPRSNSFIERER